MEDDWNEPRFVCERVCTSDKLVKKMGSLAKVTGADARGFTCRMQQSDVYAWGVGCYSRSCVKSSSYHSMFDFISKTNNWKVGCNHALSPEQDAHACTTQLSMHLFCSWHTRGTACRASTLNLLFNATRPSQHHSL